MSGCEPLSIVIYPFYESREMLVQLNSFVTVVGGHIGEDYLVSNFESVLDLDGVYCALAQRHLDLIRVLPVRLQLKELNGAVLLSEYRAPDEYYVIEAFQFDGSVHAEIRAQHARRRRVLAHDQRHIHGDRPVEDRWIDS